jgi:hypothetical protein
LPFEPFPVHPFGRRRPTRRRTSGVSLMRTRFSFRLASAAALLVLSGGLATAQQFELVGPREILPSQKVLDHFQSTTGTVQRLSLPPAAAGPFDVVVTIRGKAKLLSLHPFDMRTGDFRVLEDDGSGVLRVHPTPASVTYRGSIDGHPTGFVAGSLIDGQLHAILALDSDSALWGIQPITEVDPLAPRAMHFVYDSRANQNLPFRCGNVGFANPAHAGGNRGGPELLQTAEIAIEGDRQFWQAEGSDVARATNKINTIMNMVGAIYRRDVEVVYRITTIMITTQNVYTTNDPGGLLDQFRNRWNQNFGNIRRDLAHLFTGRNLNGNVIGVAYVGVVCNLPWAYGLSQRLGNNTYMAGLVSHEAGHNWGANHCSGGDCRIMCPGLGGCSGDVTRFGQVSKSTILGFKSGLNCLDGPPPPVINSIVPSSINAFPPGQLITLNGSGLLGVTQVLVGTTRLMAGEFTVIDDTKVTFRSPRPTTLGPAPVIAISHRLSNIVQLTYTETIPAIHLAPTIGLGGQPLAFSMGMKPGDTWFLIGTFNDNTTVNILGFDILSANPFTLGTGTLDAVGIAEYTLNVPNANLLGLQLYSQALSLGTTPPSLNRVTPFVLTRFF